LVERAPEKREVTGSTPVPTTGQTARQRATTLADTVGIAERALSSRFSATLRAWPGRRCPYRSSVSAAPSDSEKARRWPGSNGGDAIGERGLLHCEPPLFGE
jgi:hypothetical protein